MTNGNPENEIAVVVGLGPGLGAALCCRFADASMQVAVAARKPSKISTLMAELGPKARAYPCDASRENDVAKLFDKVERDLGLPHVTVFNAGAFQLGSVIETSAEDFERCWKVGCFGGFLVGREAAKRMLKRKDEVKGTIIFTSATAANRGGANFVNLAVPKFGLKALCQSMARELGPRESTCARWWWTGRSFRTATPISPRSAHPTVY